MSLVAFAPIFDAREALATVATLAVFWPPPLLPVIS